MAEAGAARVQLSMDANRALPEIAAQVGIHPRTVSRWLDLLRESGLDTRRPPPLCTRWTVANLSIAKQTLLPAAFLLREYIKGITRMGD